MRLPRSAPANRHSLSYQAKKHRFGATASAVVLPEKVVPAEAPVDSLATSFDAETPAGPASCHPAAFFFGSALIRAAAREAACT